MPRNRLSSTGSGYGLVIHHWELLRGFPGAVPPMNRILAITHDPTDIPNRCSDWLAGHGYEVVAACPANGEAIPAIDERVAGVVVFGGRHDVRDRGAHDFLRDEIAFVEATLKRELPYLGICLGGQLLAHVLGETVDGHPDGCAEYGYYDLRLTPEGRGFAPDGLQVLQSHWHGWYATPKGATLLASTERFPQQAFRYGDSAYAIQFHPEARRTTLEKWIGRRPKERLLLQGAHPAERQLADNLIHDAALQSWFHEFLDRWMGPARSQLDAPREAAE
jgi:GMP synthase (glutamine-hydrolysing)